jgi:hypothetical protein
MLRFFFLKKNCIPESIKPNYQQIFKCSNAEKYRGTNNSKKKIAMAELIMEIL